jgi:hypothetical protein
MPPTYRGQITHVPPAMQQNYGNNYPPQTFYGQPPPNALYHQPMANAFQQMGTMHRPINPTAHIDTRTYGQPAPHQMSIANRS